MWRDRLLGPQLLSAGDTLYAGTVREIIKGRRIVFCIQWWRMFIIFSTVVNQCRCCNVACKILFISSTRVSGQSTSRRRCLSCAGASTTASSHTQTSSSWTKPPSGICWRRGCPRLRSQSLSTTTCWGLEAFAFVLELNMLTKSAYEPSRTFIVPGEGTY